MKVDSNYPTKTQRFDNEYLTIVGSVLNEISEKIDRIILCPRLNKKPIADMLNII